MSIDPTGANFSRLAAILEHVDVTTKQFSVATYICPEEKVRKSAWIAGEHAIHKYRRQGKKLPKKYIRNIIDWLGAEHQIIVDREIFTRDFSSKEDFLKELQSPDSRQSRDFQQRNFKSKLVLYSALVEDGIMKGGYDFVKEDTIGRQLILEIEKIVSSESEIEAEAIESLGRIQPRSCSGCGKGMDRLIAMKPVNSAIWQRRSELFVQVDSRAATKGLATTVSKKLHHSRLSGDRDGAAAAANFLSAMIEAEKLGGPRDADRLEIEAKLIEAFAKTHDRKTLSDRFKSAHQSEHNLQSVGVLICDACCAVAMKESDAVEKIEKCRDALRDALAAFKKKGSSTVDLRYRENDIAYIEYSFIEKTFLSDLYRFGDELRRKDASIRSGKSPGKRLEALLAEYRSPIRRGKICYWLWIRDQMRNPVWLATSLALLNERADVQELCILDVSKFRHQVQSALTGSKGLR